MKKTIARLVVVVAVLGVGASSATAAPKPRECPPGQSGDPCMPDTTH